MTLTATPLTRCPSCNNPDLRRLRISGLACEETVYWSERSGRWFIAETAPMVGHQKSVIAQMECTACGHLLLPGEWAEEVAD